MMQTDSRLTGDINITEARSNLDDCIKKLLSNKQILARIMKECVSEYVGCSVDEIISLIEPSSPNRDSETISGRNTEDVGIDDGTVRYDILFDAALPGCEDRVGVIINVEAQNDFSPGYSLIRRGLYYCARLISGQKGHEFAHSEFNNIVKVYSLWICMKPTSPAKNTITRYSVGEECLVGSNAAAKKDYDILSMVLIGLSESEPSEAASGIIDMLSILLSRKLESRIKIAELERKYDISPTVEMKGDIAKMCNYSDGVYRDGYNSGVQYGLSQGIEQGISVGVRQGSYDMLCKCVKGFLAMGLSPEKIALITQTELDTVLEVIRNESDGE